VFTVFTMRKKGFGTRKDVALPDFTHQPGSSCCTKKIAVFPITIDGWWSFTMDTNPINQANSSLSHHRQTFKSHQKMQSMTNQRMNFSEIWLISIYHGISRLYHGKSG
jgi:hypothetical protein